MIRDEMKLREEACGHVTSCIFPFSILQFLEPVLLCVIQTL
jgi:hypothetical protein